MANLIVGFMRGSAIIIPMAKKLKEVALSIGWNGVKDAKGRRLLQILGTEVMRECIDEDYHIKAWMQYAEEALLSGKRILICDDIRFPNELQFMQQQGAYMIHVIGEHGDNTIHDHASEQSLPSYTPTVTIDNLSITLQDLSRIVEQFCKQYLTLTPPSTIHR